MGQNIRTTGELLTRTASLFPRKSAVLYKKAYSCISLSYRELLEKSLKAASFLRRNGLKKGDRVAVCGPNCPEWVVLFFGCAFSGIVLVPVDYNSPEEQFFRICKRASPRFAFVSFYRQALLKHENGKKKTKKCAAERKIKRFLLEDFFNIIENEKKAKPAKISEKDLLEIVYTSGTTGEPKGVLITHENIISNLLSLKEAMDITKKEKFLSILPLSHMLEQTLGLLLPLSNGCSITYLYSRKSSLIINTIKEHGISIMVCVPAFLEIMKNRILAAAKEKNKEKEINKIIRIGRKLPLGIRRALSYSVRKKIGPSLKMFVEGGAPLALETERFWNGLGIIVLQGFGLTEASPIITCNTLEERKEGSVGRPLPGQMVVIGEGNEILAKGRNITQGYYKNKKESSKLKKGEWLKTGDLGKIDEEGFLHIIGRKKNMILTSSGLNVYPEDIEKEIMKCREIKDCCVLGIKRGNKTEITAVLLPRCKFNKKKLIEKVNSSLGEHQQIRKVVVWGAKDFPRTPSLKIKRKAVEESILNKRVEKTAGSSGDKLIDIVAEVSGKSAARIREKSKLTELGIDSIGRIELISRIEDEFGKEVEEDRIKPETTIKSLRDIINMPVKKEKQVWKRWMNVSIPIKAIRIFLQCFMFVLMRITYKIEVKGKENLKKAPKQVIYTLNHTSHLDIPTFLRALPFRRRFYVSVAAAQEYFFREGNEKGFFRDIKSLLLIFLLNIFPFSRIGNIKESFRRAGYLATKKHSIAIFPEGTRTVTGKMNPFKTGIGMLVHELELPVVPVKLEGLYDILKKREVIPRFGKKAKIIFGKPLKFSQADSFIGITKKIEEEVKKLK